MWGWSLKQGVTHAKQALYAELHPQMFCFFSNFPFILLRYNSPFKICMVQWLLGYPLHVLVQPSPLCNFRTLIVSLFLLEDSSFSVISFPFKPKEFSLSFLTAQLAKENKTVCYYQSMSLFCLHSWRIFSLNIKLWVDSLVSVHLNIYSHVSYMLHFAGCFHDIFVCVMAFIICQFN